SFIRYSKNLFDGIWRVLGIGADSKVYTNNTLFRSAVIPIEDNKTYSIKVHGTHNQFAVGVQDVKDAQTVILKLHDKTLSEYTFTNTTNKYLYVWVSSIGEEPLI